MKRFKSNIIIGLGVLIITIGVIGTPVIQDLMPLEGQFSSNTHVYYRVVKAPPEPPPYIPIAIISIGVLISIAGVFVRRRKN